MNELVTYSRFYTTGEAAAFATQLSDAGIASKIEWEKNMLDKIYIGESFDPLVVIKIARSDFEKANKLSASFLESSIDDIDPDYYLFSFSDIELADVIRNEAEWNSFDRTLAKKLLQQRNVSFDIDRIVLHKENQSHHIRLSTTWLVAEYLISIYLPWAGILIGLATLYSFKTLSNGERVKMYDGFTRMHATILLLIGVIRIFMFFLFDWFIFPFFL